MKHKLAIQLLGVFAFFSGCGIFLISISTLNKVNIFHLVSSIVIYIAGVGLLTYPVEGGKRGAYFLATLIAPLTFFGAFFLWDLVRELGIWLPFVVELGVSFGIALLLSFLIIKYMSINK